MDGRADKRCTPGVTNPAVTQATIWQTICVSGWTATIRPPVAYTNRLKTAGMRAYGETGSPAVFEEDHLINLGVGGSPTDPANLWPEPRTGPRPAGRKDQEEVQLRRKTLAMARAQIQSNWTH